MKINAIITGSTGMVGEGVLRTCLDHPDVEKVLVVNRRPCGISHPKLTEVIHPNFFDFSPIESELSGYNACFFCLGVSSVGMKEDKYRHLTYNLTMHVAETLSRLNPDMTFCYVSGAATDSTEKGKLMWARVKGKTENDLMKLPFKKACMFRPGIIKPVKGQIHIKATYKLFLWMYPFVHFLFPKFSCTLKEIGLAMINTVNHGPENNILEVKDIVELAKV
jgi:hypothetical protein